MSLATISVVSLVILVLVALAEDDLMVRRDNDKLGKYLSDEKWTSLRASQRAGQLAVQNSKLRDEIGKLRELETRVNNLRVENDRLAIISRNRGDLLDEYRELVRMNIGVLPYDHEAKKDS